MAMLLVQNNSNAKCLLKYNNDVYMYTSCTQYTLSTAHLVAATMLRPNNIMSVIFLKIHSLHVLEAVSTLKMTQ